MISFIVPIYNAEKYLTDCIDSLLGQTTTEPLEIILVNDGSTDNSLTIAQAYAKKHAEDPLRKILLFTQQHSGQSIARNYGMEQAIGEYIAFVDADDRIAPDWCNRHLKAIKGVDYVQSGYRRTSDTEDKGWRVGIRQLPEHRYRYTSPCMRLYRRSALRNIRFEGGMIYEDVIFSADLWLSGATCKKLDYAGYLYTKNPDSTTSRVHLDAQKRVLEELHNRLPYASWKGKYILWLTIIRLKLYFIMEMRKNMNVLALMVLLTTLTASLNATTRYASPVGGRDGMSYTSPATWSAALSATQSGDTLYLLGGHYSFSAKQTIGTGKNGMSANRRTFIGAYPGEKPVLDFSEQPYGSEVTGSNNVGISISSGALYIHIKGLCICYAGKNGLINYGSYCLIEGLDVYGCGDTGIQMKNGGDNTILNCDSHDNFDYKTMSGSSANFGGNADGFADKQFTGAGNHYIGCRAWNNSDDGWDFFQRVSNSNTIVENCICFRNGCPYYDMSHNPRALGVDKSWFDGKVDTTMKDRYGQTITITLEQYPCQGNGNGFKMGGNQTNHKILIHHSHAVGNYARGFDQNNNAGTMWVYNCSAYQNAFNYGFTTACGTNSLQNCISLNGQGGDAYKSQNVAANDHNTWSNGFAVSADDFRSLDTTMILSPRQADGNLAEVDFMRLRDGSALIDAGVNVNLSYNGSAPDLGCYEYPGEEHKPDTIPEDTIPTIQPEGTHAVAFVTITGAEEDKPLLQYLRQNDSLWIVTTEATDPTVDYSPYEVIVLGMKPTSSAAGFGPLKGYNKPMVLLKPWLLKQGVWSWGTAINTADLSIAVSDPSHPLFEGLEITDGQLPLFSQCNTNAVTAISEWSIQPTVSIQTLASPVSQPDAAAIAVLPAGTDCNGTVLPQPMIMIGVSEYSTLYLTDDAKRLIENAILYQLGISMPEGIENQKSKIINHKFIRDGQLFIQAGDAVYDTTGRRLMR